MCKQETPTVISVAGSERWGYSVGTSYIACNSEQCRKTLTGMPSDQVMLYPLGFDTILQFGWASGGTKFDEKAIADLMKQLAGWTRRRLTAENAAQFIDGLTLR